MAASIDLCELADVKTYLGITDTSEDTLLGALIDSASQAIERYCRRKFKQETLTEYHDGMEVGKLALRRAPINSITTIHDDTDREYGSGTLVDSDNYTYYAQSGIVVFDGDIVMQDGNKNVKVVYSGGFGATTAALPEDLQLACQILTAALWTRAKQGAAGIESETTEGYSVKWRGELPVEVALILKGYRLIAMGGADA